MKLLSKYVLLICFILSVATSAIFAQAVNIRVNDEVRSFKGLKWVPGEILVKFKEGVTQEKIGKLNKKHGMIILSKSKYGKFTRLKVPIGKTIASMVKIYSQNKNVIYAEPNYIATAFDVVFTPGDEFFKYQWNLKDENFLDTGTTASGIMMETAWAEVNGNSSVIVAVVDTGVAYQNSNQKFRGVRYQKAPDLNETNFFVGDLYDFINDDSEPMDDNGHGTHVTGTIAQSTNTEIIRFDEESNPVYRGVAGIAFETTIMPVKVLNHNGSGSYSVIAQGISFAIANGADIINLSLGGSFDSNTLRIAIEDAYNAGVTIICAAGNEFNSGNTVSYPAAYPECIGVGATRIDKTKAPYSNTGFYVEIAAPGGDTNPYEDRNEDGYVDGILQQTFGRTPSDWAYYFYQGTSMAAPHVSGVAALLLDQNSTSAVSPLTVKEALLRSSINLANPIDGRNDEFGWGLLNAPAALAYTLSTDLTDVNVSIVSVDDNETNSVEIDRTGITVIPVNIDYDVSDADSSMTLKLFDHTQGVLLDTEVISSSGTHIYDWNISTVNLGSHILKAVVNSPSDEINTVNNYSYVTVTIVEDEGTVPDPDTGSPTVATVGTVTTSYKKQGKISYVGKVNVTIVDESGIAISGANVTADWTINGITTPADPATSDEFGVSKFTSPKSTDGTFIITIIKANNLNVTRDANNPITVN